MPDTWETGEWGGDIACDMGHLGQGEVSREQRAGNKDERAGRTKQAAEGAVTLTFWLWTQNVW